MAEQMAEQIAERTADQCKAYIRKSKRTMISLKSDRGSRNRVRSRRRVVVASKIGWEQALSDGYVGTKGKPG